MIHSKETKAAPEKEFSRRSVATLRLLHDLITSWLAEIPAIISVADPADSGVKESLSMTSLVMQDAVVIWHL